MNKSGNEYKKVKWLFGKEIEIPEAWKSVKIEWIADKLLSGGTPSTFISEYWNGNVAWTKGATLTVHYLIQGERFISKAGLKNSSSSIIPKNNLLVVSRVSIGNLSINKINVAINQDITAIILNTSLCFTEFLYWSLLSSIDILVSFSQGTTIQGFTRKDLSNHIILLPSLREQQKIASILSGVDALIGSTQRIIEKTERLKKGLMQNLLTRGISHTKFKKVKGLFGKEIKIPEEWAFESVQAKINILPGFAFDSKNFDEKKGLPLIRIRDLANADTKTRYCGDFSNAFLINVGDLLVGMDGEFRPHLWKGKHALLNQRVCKITTNDNKILDQNFIFYAIKKKLLHYELVNIGTTVIHISKKDIEKITIPTPLIEEQQKIASILSGVDAYIQKNQQYKEKLEKLKKGLMQKLLTGQIQVKV